MYTIQLCMHADPFSCMHACMHTDLHACSQFLHACKWYCMHAGMHAHTFACMQHVCSMHAACMHCLEGIYNNECLISQSISHNNLQVSMDRRDQFFKWKCLVLQNTEGQSPRIIVVSFFHRSISTLCWVFISTTFNCLQCRRQERSHNSKLFFLEQYKPS